MRILHYFLGFPPYRSGGMTKFAVDLMQEQANDGNAVFALWPGKMCGSVPKIKKTSMEQGIENYELINPLPVPLDEGIKKFSEFTKPCNKIVYESFLQTLKVDVVHVHTLMGIHKEFFEVCQDLNIKTVFTSHDYFGICPRVTLFRCGECCDDDCNCNSCAACNEKALPIWKIRLLQSPLYRKLKTTKVVSIARKKHRMTFLNELEKTHVLPDEHLSQGYRDLRAFYVSILESIDIIHFNSNLTRQIFERYMTPKKGVVLPISHKDVQDHRDVQHTKGEKLRIVYLSQHKKIKGYDFLKATLDSIWESGNHDFELDLYQSVSELSPYMVVKQAGYTYKDLPDIYSNADISVVPSLCYETFGFTVLEAICYGVPVIVSNHVGAKDLLHDADMVFCAGDEQLLKKLILQLDDEKLQKHREKLKNINIPLWSDIVNSIFSMYVQ